jgi:2-oxoglutarate/2-oxoacid ferredoxin oxidoreductase subunit alpha
VGGTFIQMEDEIASIGAIIGASWAGRKVMTATSGPGFSLMMEGFGYAVMTETPIVVVDVQRAGPCTGQATHIGQGDVMQVKFGTHGDIMPIALSPWSVQEMYDDTIQAFNLAERFRVPVFLMADEGVGHLRETASFHRRFTVTERVRGEPGCQPFGTEALDGVPPMPIFGDGANLLVTGSTHDAAGFRKNDHPAEQDRLVRRLTRKILDRRDEIVAVERIALDDAEVAIVAYGFMARSAWAAVRRLRGRGRRVGMLRLRTLWPFPEREIAELGRSVRRILMPELNLGQLVTVVRAGTPTEVVALNQVNGKAMEPSTIMARLEELW